MKNIGLAIGAALALGSVLFFAQPAPQIPFIPPIYVSPTGVDATCKVGKSTMPCLTLNKAYTLARPGQQIRMLGGTYAAQTILRSTTNGKPGTRAVIIEPASGQTVTIDGVVNLGVDAGTASPSYVTFNGLHRTTMKAFKVNYGSATVGDHVTLENSHIASLDWGPGGSTGGQNGLVYTRDGSHFTITGNEIGPGCCTADAISLYLRNNTDPNPTDIIVRNNFIHDVYDTCTETPTYLGTCTGTGFGDGAGVCGAGCAHVDGVQTYGCVRCTFDRNRVYLEGDHKQGFFIAADVGGTAVLQDIAVTNNFIFNGKSDIALGIKATTDNLGSGYLKILYNTIVSRSGLGLYFENTSYGANVKWTNGSTFSIVGNIVDSGGQTKCGSTWLYSDGSTPLGSNFVWNYNMLGSAAACGANDIGNTTPTFVQGSFPNAGSNCGLSPANGGLADGSSDCADATGVPNLDLSGAQSAIDAGDSTYCPFTDVHGVQRPIPTACDIGAQEVG